MVTVVKIQRRHCWSNASPRWRRCFWLLKLPNFSKLSLTFPDFPLLPQLSLTLLYAPCFFELLVSFALHVEIAHRVRCLLGSTDITCTTTSFLKIWQQHPAGVWSVRRHRWLSGLICHLVECLVFFLFSLLVIFCGTRLLGQDTPSTLAARLALCNPSAASFTWPNVFQALPKKKTNLSLRASAAQCSFLLPKATGGGRPSDCQYWLLDALG
jgi:hypothetical protein